MKILVIEDDANASAYVRKALTDQGFVVDVASGGDEGLDLSLAGDYDLVVLDLMLPDRDGWSVLSELRRAGKQTPVLVLSAKDQVKDRVRGLELGADDYLVKPFAFSELLARVRSILRRGPVRSPETLVIGDLSLDLVRHRAMRQGRRLDLTPKEFALLSLLVRRSGEVLSRALIAEQVWDMNFDSDTNVIDVHVRRLRTKLDDPFDAKLIHTVRGMGYVLEVREDGDGKQPAPSAPDGLRGNLKGSLSRRLDALEKATGGFKGTLGASSRAEGERLAHMLAGSLGTLGLPEGTRLARELEDLLEDAKSLRPGDLARGSALLAALRDALA